MFVRYFYAVFSGALMTLSLLFVMHALINIQPGAFSEARPRALITFGSVREPVPPATKPPPIKLQDLTNAPIPPTTRPVTGSEFTIGIPSGDPVRPRTDFTMTTADYVDGPLFSGVRVQPVYPARAKARGLEGYVIVQFDVTATGQVQNAVVVESSHTIFEKSSLQAVMRFKFRPRVVDGSPLASTGIQNIFRFELEQE